MHRLLFVCTENANRSQIAEAFARHHGGDRVLSCSAGSNPSGGVNPRALASMRRRGIELADHRSKGLEALPPSRWDVLVTMGCGDRCPSLPAERRLDWELDDPRDLPDDAYDLVRDDIERRVLALLAELDAKPSQA